MCGTGRWGERPRVNTGDGPLRPDTLLSEVELDAEREYRFRYLFDGEHWRYDWHADKSLPSPYGAYDSVVMASLPLASC
ncbi:MAG: hypothetical protein JSV81_18305 [Anaerolineales bacterium]|nr:MAG: hypothetical protein JSV81_18305 [Anaerolineales bacterium]